MSRLNTETILSLFLGFVVIWFGYNEVTNPEAWGVYVPSFIGATGAMLNNLVMAHGAVLVLSGLAIIFNFHRKAGASVIALMLLSIVITLVMGAGLDDVAVRDIGLFGMALALALKNH